MQLTLQNIASIATAFNQGRTDLTLSEVSFYANLAVGEVATRTQHLPLEGLAISSTTSGENRVTLPTDFDYPINLSLSSGSNVWTKQLQAREATWLDSGTTTNGEPSYYALYGTWLEVWPTPDSAYSLTLRYGAKVPVMTASTSTPALAERYHYAVALKTAEMCAAARNDLDQEAICRARYLSYMNSTPSDMAYRQRVQEGMAVALQKGRR